jgi:hypothetical protein
MGKAVGSCRYSLAPDGEMREPASDLYLLTGFGGLSIPEVSRCGFTSKCYVRFVVLKGCSRYVSRLLSDIPSARSHGLVWALNLAGPYSTIRGFDIGSERN